MKKTLNILFLFCFAMQIQAQEMPSIKVGKDKLGISSLDIKVEVVGNIATTTYDMLFYNPTPSILEGELAFPLGDGQNVSRLALEVNGKLREAVVVEKEQGRIAFEAVVRRGVDPVLLEKGTGNNYKARIYPIPANGYKHVVLAHEQELILSEGAHYFQLPLDFKKNLDHFALEMNIFDQKLAPALTKGHLDNFKFSAIHTNYFAKIAYKNFRPAESLTLKIPLNASAHKTISSEDFFYVYKALNPEKRIRNKANRINLYWDVSLSMQDRNLESEMAFLDAYFQYLNTTTVTLVKFSNDISFKKTYKIKEGQWKQLKNELKHSVYDGGTSYEQLFLNDDSDESLLFSDGMKNLSELKLQQKQPMFVINSLLKANHAELRQICETTQGKYINLKQSSANEALEAIKFQAFKFLGVETENKVLEIYPIAPRIVANDFSLVAKNARTNESITLLFGYANEITQRVHISVQPDINNILVKRIWAQKKLNALQKESDVNKEAIISHAKAYNLVSNHTSLIVLETVWDYVRYKITPPEELLAEYQDILARHKGQRVGAIESKDDEDKQEEQLEADATEDSKKGGVEKSISGTISDEDGMPLPGVNIIVKGTSNGTQTDFDGNYAINASPGDILTFSFIGYSSAEVDVTSASNISFGMMVDAESIDEVVITALGIKRKADQITSAYQLVETEELVKANNPEVINSLSGKVTGLQITQNSNGVDSESRIVLRGNRSISGNNQALIVIDGAISSSEFLNALDPNQIRSINVIKGANGAALYGSQGSNGVIVVTTTPTLQIRGSNNTSEESNTSTTEQSNTNIVEPAYKVDTLENNASYIEELRVATSAEEAYEIYLKQRVEYAALPAYYVDVSDYFKTWKHKEYAARILTNIAEIDFDNYELLRVLAYKLEETNNYKLAGFIYAQVLKLRPEDAQSYRDLALVYQELGMDKEAHNLLNSIVNESIYKTAGRRRFEGMQTISKNEIKKLENNKKTFDLRITIDWNHNDTDIDLHIIDPRLEECSYANNRTSMGGRMSQDMTQGFGPEEFTLNKAKPGAYFVKIHYFGDRYQKVENPTFMKVTIFKNYGKPSETKEIKIIRLLEANEDLIVARIDV